jgi:hypothetical protein
MQRLAAVQETQDARKRLVSAAAEARENWRVEIQSE